MSTIYYSLNRLVHAISQQVATPARGIFTGMLLAMLVIGCKKDPDPQPANTLTARAGDDQQAPVGQLVTLDATASLSADSQPFSIDWVLLHKPAKSTAILTRATTPKPTFTPDEVGEYELELTVANASGRSMDRVVVVASVAQPLTMDKDIRVKTLLTARIAGSGGHGIYIGFNALLNADATVSYANNALANVLNDN